MKKYIIVTILISIVTSCVNKNSEIASVEEASNETTVELTIAQLSNAEIATGKIEKRNLSTLLKVNGKIDVPPQNMVTVSVPMGGYLRSTKLLAGMHVKKGEIIATMEDQKYIQLQEDYLTAKIQLVAIEAEYVRQKELNESKASSDKVFQTASAEYHSQKILIKSLSEKLKLIGVNPSALSENTMSKRINIVSPIDGFVSDVKMNIGKYVSPTDVLFELVNPSDIHLSLTIFEKDLDKISIGQNLVAYTNINPDKKHYCKIFLISQDVSQEGTIQVHCHFEDYDKTLIPGMYMNAEVEVAETSAYVIPNEGLVRFEGKQYVFDEIGANKFEMKAVTTLNTSSGFTQIAFEDTTDIADTKFVIKGAYTLLMKMKNQEED